MKLKGTWQSTTAQYAMRLSQSQLQKNICEQNRNKRQSYTALAKCSRAQSTTYHHNKYSIYNSEKIITMTFKSTKTCHQ